MTGKSIPAWLQAKSAGAWLRASSTLPVSLKPGETLAILTAEKAADLTYAGSFEH